MAEGVVGIEIDAFDAAVRPTRVVVPVDDRTQRGEQRRGCVREMTDRVGLGPAQDGDQAAERADLTFGTIADTRDADVPDRAPRPISERLDQAGKLLRQGPRYRLGHRWAPSCAAAWNRT